MMYKVTTSHYHQSAPDTLPLFLITSCLTSFLFDFIHKINVKVNIASV